MDTDVSTQIRDSYTAVDKYGNFRAPEEIEKSLRYRINISISVKAVKTWDCTCDGNGFTMEEILERSDSLVKALEKRYPIKGE